MIFKKKLYLKKVEKDIWKSTFVFGHVFNLKDS